MSLLQKLLGLDFPDGTSLTSSEIALRGGLRWWTVVLMIAAVVGYATWFYRRERIEVSRGQRILCTTLRGLALSILVFMVARPAMIAEGHGTRPRGIAVLIDNSQSLKQTDRRLSAADLLRVAIAKGQAPPNALPDDPQWQSTGKDEHANISRADLLRSVLSNPQLDLVNRLEKKQPVKVYLFGDKARRIGTTSIAKAVTAEDDRTALADALLEIAAGGDGDPPSAIVLLSDGIDNASKESLDAAAAECAKQGVAVHVYGVGSTDSGALRLVDAAIPETVFVDDVASVPVRWRYRGSNHVAAVLTATFGGKEVSRKELILRPGDGKDTLTFTPDKRVNVGTPELVVAIRLKEDPAPADEIRKLIGLSERRVRVLVVDDSPRWEFKFLQPALSRDRRVEATYVVAQGDPRAVRSEPFIPTFPSRDKLFTYDLVILGDVAPAFLGTEGLLSLVDYVREGGGLCVVSGRKHMPAAYADTPFAEMLPVDFVPVKFPPVADARTTPFQPALTPAGRRSEMLSLGDSAEENDRIWKELPGFYWHYPVTKLRPGATTLIAHPRKLADDTPAPLAAVHHYGKGQVLFLAADEIWRWRYNTGDRLYARFWGQVVYQLGLPHLLGHGSRTQLSLDRSEAVVGRPGYMYARLYDGEYRPYVAERVPAVLDFLDAPAGANRSKLVMLEPVPGRPGEYRTLLAHDAPGRYEFKVSQPEAGSVTFRVALPPGHELEPAGLNEAALQDLAKTTHGGFYREEELYKLPGNVTPKLAPYTVRQEVLMWNPLMLILFVALVTGEWIMRKLANLS